MNRVQQQSVTGTLGRLWQRIVSVATVIVVGSIAVGCATTETSQTQPKAVTAVAKPNNAYTVRRAAVRTPAVRQRARQQKPARHARTKRPAQQRRFPKQLTKAQYHARYQAQKRAAEKAAEERRRAEILARIARKKAEEAATRKHYVSKWQHKQQQRLAYNKSWQQEQLAKQRQAQIAARKAEAQRKLAARKAEMQRKIAARKPSPPKAIRVATAPTRKPAAQKKAWARKPLTPQRKHSVQKRPDPRAKYLARWKRLQAEKRLEAKRAEQRVERVIHSAKKQIGRKYVWGGASPKQGFDCSGLVQHSINKGAKVSVPRTAFQQHKASIKVPAHKAERGDLVFFVTRGKRVSHVGIYLGDNKFVHAPRTGRTVTTSSIKGYWKKRFVGFGRIPGACRLPMPPRA